jgi:hypothetical protein
MSTSVARGADVSAAQEVSVDGGIRNAAKTLLMAMGVRLAGWMGYR